MQIIVAVALFDDLNRAPDDIGLAQPDDSLAGAFDFGLVYLNVWGARGSADLVLRVRVFSVVAI